MLTDAELRREAARSGFRPEVLEKVLRLLELLEALRSHPFLGSECRDLLSVVLPLEPAEHEFLERLNGRGEIAPELLTADERLQTLLRKHPGLRWKAVNVRKHLGRPDREDR